MSRKFLIRRSIVCYLLMLFMVATASAEKKGTGGTHSNFNYGVGARALSLGNAYVAMPFDASAIYWNPSGLDHIQYRNVSLFYSNLLVGVNYYFLGYVHPTTSIGTFGAGVISYGVDGIEITDKANVPYGNDSVTEQLFLFSYGKKLPWNLSAGINLKIQHQDFAGFVATGVGTDVGFLYHPDFTHPLLSGFTLGLMIQNLVGPRLKAGVATDVMPINVRLGLAKPILKNEWGPAMTLFVDLEQGERAPFKCHAGAEYVFQNRAMLRMGMNNNQMAFGAGATFDRFQLDYSYGKFSEHELNASHRLSFTVQFGKSKQERIQIAEERRLREIRERVDQELFMDRQQKIAEALKEGKAYLEAEDFPRAIREFNFILKYEEELSDDLVVEEAKKLHEQAEQGSFKEVEQN
ncbi:MAG: PorV/PorQ family protein, partial [bacterium]|nr:PorV/PorQ family protein [bacterium]